jgi:hypothetical protein
MTLQSSNLEKYWLVVFARVKHKSVNVSKLTSCGLVLVCVTMSNYLCAINYYYFISSMAPLSVRFGVRSRKLDNVGQSLDG